MKKFIKVCAVLGAALVLIGGITSTVAAGMGAQMKNVIAYSHNRWGDSWARDLADDLEEDVMHGLGRWEHHMDWDDDYDYDYDDDYDYNYDYHDDYDDDYDYDSDDYLALRERYEAAPKSTDGRLQFSVSGIEELEVDVREGAVIFVEDDSTEEIGVYCDADGSYWTAGVDERELKIKARPASWDLKNYSDTTVYVYIPKGFLFDKIEMDVKAGNENRNHTGDHSASVYADSLSAREMDIDVKGGVVKIMNGNAGELDLSCDVGVVDFEGTVSGGMEASCDVGSVLCKLTGSKSDYNYEIESRLGAITVGNQSYAGLSSKKRINNNAGKKMELKCNVGALKVTFTE